MDVKLSRNGLLPWVLEIFVVRFIILSKILPNPRKKVEKVFLFTYTLYLLYTREKIVSINIRKL